MSVVGICVSECGACSVFAIAGAVAPVAIVAARVSAVADLRCSIKIFLYIFSFSGLNIYISMIIHISQYNVVETMPSRQVTSKASLYLRFYFFDARHAYSLE
jgi:hypothetical protein